MDFIAAIPYNVILETLSYRTYVAMMDEIFKVLLREEENQRPICLFLLEPEIIKTPHLFEGNTLGVVYLHLRGTSLQDDFIVMYDSDKLSQSQIKYMITNGMVEKLILARKAVEKMEKENDDKPSITMMDKSGKEVDVFDFLNNLEKNKN